MLSQAFIDLLDSATTRRMTGFSTGFSIFIVRTYPTAQLEFICNLCFVCCSMGTRKIAILKLSLGYPLNSSYFCTWVLIEPAVFIAKLQRRLRHSCPDKPSTTI